MFFGLDWMVLMSVVVIDFVFWHLISAFCLKSAFVFLGHSVTFRTAFKASVASAIGGAMLGGVLMVLAMYSRSIPLYLGGAVAGLLFNIYLVGRITRTGFFGALVAQILALIIGIVAAVGLGFALAMVLGALLSGPVGGALYNAISNMPTNGP